MANERARSLRKRMTPQEVKLWVHLRAWRAQGFHFRRQVPHGRFILDFACLKHGLVIEIDGSHHGFSDGERRDRQRDRTLANDGFRVLRFWNNEVDGNLEGVLHQINDVLSARARQMNPSPDKGRVAAHAAGWGGGREDADIESGNASPHPRPADRPSPAGGGIGFSERGDGAASGSDKEHPSPDKRRVAAHAAGWGGGREDADIESGNASPHPGPADRPSPAGGGIGFGERAKDGR